MGEGFPGGTSGKEHPCQFLTDRLNTLGFDLWVRKISWRRVWQSTPVFLLRESPWTEEPGGLRSIGSERVGHDWSDLTHMEGNVKWLKWTLLRCHLEENGDSGWGFDLGWTWSVASGGLRQLIERVRHCLALKGRAEDGGYHVGPKKKVPRVNFEGQRLKIVN